MFAMRVAVAVAIIKTKPETISAEDYTRSLQSKLFQIQLKLSKDLEKAKLRILNLEDKLAEVQTKSNETSPSSPNDAQIMLTPPPSSSSRSQCNNQPSHGQGDTCLNNETVTIDIESSRFTQSVMNLQNCCLRPQESEEIVKRLVQDNIGTISDVLSCGMVAIPESCLCKAARVVGDLFHVYPPLQDCGATMEAICHLIETILSRMKEPSNYQQLHPHRLKISLMQMLLTLTTTSTSHLSVLILDSLMESWEEFCHALRYSRHTAVPLNPHDFDSSFFIIRVIELMTKSWLEDRCMLDSVALALLQDRLDESLLHLTNHFPLVSQVVWKVTSVIETILQAYQTDL